MGAKIGLWGLENLNPMIFMQRTPVSSNLSKNINFSTKIAQDYIWTHTILSGNKNLRSIKGCNSVANLRNLTLYNLNLDINVMCIQNVVKLCALVLKILSGNEMVTELRTYRLTDLRKDRANPI